MSSMNRAILVGKLGKDPVLRYTQENKPVATFSLATNESYTNKNGEKSTTTEWHNITVWGKIGENAEKYLSKGRDVLVEGKIQYKKYTDKEGVERYQTDILAQRLVYLGGNNNSIHNGDIPF